MTLDEWVALSSEERNQYRRRWTPTDDPMDQVNDWDQLLAEAERRFRLQYGQHPLVNFIGCSGSVQGRDVLVISVTTAHFSPLVIEELPDRFMTFPVVQHPIADQKRWRLMTWTLVLDQLLGWSEERVRNWAKERHEDGLDGKDGGWFYHEDAYYYILHLLVPVLMREHLGHAELSKLEQRIRSAISGHGSSPLWLSPYDWDAARERINSILHEYGYKLPTKE